MSVDISNRRFQQIDDIDMPAETSVSLSDSYVMISGVVTDIIAIYNTTTRVYITDSNNNDIQLAHVDSGIVWDNAIDDGIIYVGVNNTITDAQYTWLTSMFADLSDTVYLARGSSLTAVANAIRTKGGTSALLEFPSGFITAIENIPSSTGVDWFGYADTSTIKAETEA